MNTYTFKLIIETDGSRNRAEMAALVCFAKRLPDGCDFYLQDTKKPKTEHCVNPARLVGSCRRCGAGPDQPCIATASRNGEKKGTPMKTFHPQRK